MLPATMKEVQSHCHSAEERRTVFRMAGGSSCRQNFHEECEAAVNKQINLMLTASYTYLSVAFHFDRDDVSQRHIHEFFLKKSQDERTRAMQLMAFQNQRGGRLVMHDIKKPNLDDWSDCKGAFSTALKMEKELTQAFLDLHGTADKHGDAHMSDFIEDNFLQDQVTIVKELGDLLTNIKRNGPGVGEFLFDKYILEDIS